MRLDETAKFYAYYDVSYDVREGMTLSAATYVSSYAEELDKGNNSAITETTVVPEEEPILQEPPPEDGE
jgi:hypothetical protein